MSVDIACMPFKNKKKFSIYEIVHKKVLENSPMELLENIL